MRRIFVLVVALLVLFAFVAYAGSTVRIVVNGREMSPSPPAQVIDNRVFVPLRFVSDALGASVEWNADTRTVTVLSPVLTNAEALEVIDTAKANSEKRMLSRLDLTTDFAANRQTVNGNMQAVLRDIVIIQRAVDGQRIESTTAYLAIVSINNWLLYEYGIYEAFLKAIDAAERNDFVTGRAHIDAFNTPQVRDYIARFQGGSRQRLAELVNVR